MGFKTPITIAQVIQGIDRNLYLLPAIQREFVWGMEKIEWLFDSVMRDYPISSFLFWEVEGETKSQYKFYKFLNSYRERFETHNEEINTKGINDFMAVLDGQQRLTSLYIGIKGSYAKKKPNVRYINNEINIPTRFLYLNIEETLKDEEDGRIYEFKFLTEEEYEKNKSKWFKVGDILNFEEAYDITEYLEKKEQNTRFANKTLNKLYQKIFVSQSINYFLEKEQNIDKALNIFIRINSGGQPLNFSDLLMSIAVANWEEKDARKEIHGLVDEINKKGFCIDKDLILKIFLYLYSNDIKFKVTNFSADNAKDFENKWMQISEAILEVFTLLENYGFNDKTLSSKNAIIPIVYYIYHRNIVYKFSERKCYEDDRILIKEWLNIALIKRIFGGQADNILRKIRYVFTEEFEKIKVKQEIDRFPKKKIVEILKGTVKDMTLDDEYLENILNTKKGETLSFSILSLLYPNLDYKNGNFHEDHIHAATFFNKKSYVDNVSIKEEKYEIYEKEENWNSIINLQLLDSIENTSKQSKTLKQWANNEANKQGVTIEKFCENHLIPNILEFEKFDVFIEQRKSMIINKLKKLF